MPFKDGQWKPNIKQERFLAIPSSVREGFYGGGAGSGKSEVLLMYGILKGWHKNPLFKQVFMRRSFPELRNEIVPRSRELYKPFGATFNKTDMAWTFPSGAMVFLAHCENEDDVHSYDSMEINLFTPDELTSFTEFIYLYIGFTRVRSSDPSLPAIIRTAGMPGDIGHTWVYNRFIKPCPKGDTILYGKGGNKRIFVPATLADNPHIDKSYSQALDALPEQERQAKKFGDWNSYEGQVFEEYREKHYPNEPDNAIHLVPEFDIPKWWPRVVSIDWGFSAMTSIGFGAVAPSRRVYIYRHLAYTKTKIEDWGSEVKYLIDAEQPMDIVICHSANQNRGEPHTIKEQVEDALGQTVRLGEKDRISGKILLHEYLRFIPKRHVPAHEIGTYDSERGAWILRNKGQEAYELYLKQFVPPEPEDNLPKLQMFDNPGCRMIGDAIKSCVYEKAGSDGKKREDVAEFAGDDPYDMLRMLIHAVDKFFSESAIEKEKIDKQSTIIESFNRTGDMTAYYRNMRRLESEQRELPIRRFHRGRNALPFRTIQ